ncbi:hypothetical protein C0Z11_01095 [Acidipropionibacterium jensenii]|nr:hypothetical protein C0Z11_01095 [Acidipropionibacterium jensenii]
MLVAGTLVAGPQISSPTPAAAAGATSLSPANPMKSERFNYYSSVPTSFVRPVVLQKKVGNSWRTIFSGRTAASGRFRFTVHTGSVDTLRSYAGAISYQGRIHPAVATAPITVRPVDQKVSLSVTSPVGPRRTLTATAATSPARAGRAVSLQALRSGAWVTIASGKVAANGRGTFRTAAPAAVGSYSYRIVAGRWNGAPSRASAVVRGRVAALAPSWTPCPATAVWAVQGLDDRGVWTVAMCGNTLTSMLPDGRKNTWRVVKKYRYGARALSPDNRVRLWVDDVRDEYFYTINNFGPSWSVRRSLVVTRYWIR